MAAAKPKRLITHSEDFHTDDVFATALLLDLFPDAEVIRSRDEAVIATGDIVYDVGKVFDPARGRFDHHQAQAGERDNGIIYSSFGLLWREYGLQYCDGDKAVWESIDKKLAVSIDANDNGQDIVSPKFTGVAPFTIDDIIHAMNPLPWVHEAEDHDEQFHNAVELAAQVLERARAAAQDDLLSQKYLHGLYDAADDKRILVTEKVADVTNVLNDCPELLYVISPRPTGTWGVLAVSTEPGGFTPRRRFPEAWRGQPTETLVNVTGVSDVVFCHVNGFFAVAGSQAGALALAQKALE